MPDHPLSRTSSIRTLLAQLELVSHAPTRNYEGRAPRSSDESVGGKLPAGSDREHPDRRNADEVAAFLASYHRKTVFYFRRRLEGCESPVLLDAIRREIEETIEAWRKTPIPVGQEPEYGSPQWKAYIALSVEDAGVLAGRFHVTRRYINMVRRQYREVAA